VFGKLFFVGGDVSSGTHQGSLGLTMVTTSGFTACHTFDCGVGNA
jgi:hypothetical protein